MNDKWYYLGWNLPKELEEPANHWLSRNGEKPKPLSRDEALILCQEMNKADIKMHLRNGTKHPCGEFKIEERSPDRVVVFCEVPTTVEVATT